MRLAISVQMHEDFLKFAMELAGAQLAIGPSVAESSLLALIEEFSTFKEGRPHLEKVRETIRGYIAGSLETYVQLKDGGEFISLADYIVRLEKELLQLTEEVVGSVRTTCSTLDEINQQMDQAIIDLGKRRG